MGGLGCGGAGLRWAGVDCAQFWWAAVGFPGLGRLGWAGVELGGLGWDGLGGLGLAALGWAWVGWQSCRGCAVGRLWWGGLGCGGARLWDGLCARDTNS